MSVSVFSQVWKVYEVWRLRADLGDADRLVLRGSPAWGEGASALCVDSLINGFPLTPLVVQSCRDSRGKGRLRDRGCRWRDAIAGAWALLVCGVPVRCGAYSRRACEG